MEILQFLISFFLKEFSGEKLQTIIDLFQNNSFDLNKIINNQTSSIKFENLKALCDILECTPNDLFEEYYNGNKDI